MFRCQYCLGIMLLTISISIPHAWGQCEFRRGDADGDGDADIGDVVYLLNFLFRGPIPGPPCPDAADFDNNGKLQVADAVHVLRMQPIPLPGSVNCGPDPIVPSDSLGACVYDPTLCSSQFVKSMGRNDFLTAFKASIAMEFNGQFVRLMAGAMARVRFQAVLEHLLAGDLCTALDEIKALDALQVRYWLVRVNDANIQGPVYGFMERVLPGTPDYKGWGAVLVRTNTQGDTVYQAPHPDADEFSEDIMLDAFLADPNGIVAQFAGTHRNASCNSACEISCVADCKATCLPQPDCMAECTSCTEPCPSNNCVTIMSCSSCDANNDGDPDSDVPNDGPGDNLFHFLTQVLAVSGNNSSAPFWFVQIHGSRDRDAEPTIIASSGGGTSMNPTLPATSPLVRINNSVDSFLAAHSAGTPAMGASMGVCGHCEGTIANNMCTGAMANDETGHAVGFDGVYPLCATQNVQGDYLENTLNLRRTFMHFEIERSARNGYMGDGNSDGTIDQSPFDPGLSGVQSLLDAIADVLNTPTGKKVIAMLDPNVSVSFSEVTVAGGTSVIQSTINPGSGTGKFKFPQDTIFYDVQTTATNAPGGKITVCVTYDETKLGGLPEKDLKFLHLEGIQWVDRTSSLNTTTNTICAEVASLSWLGAGFDATTPQEPRFIRGDCNGDGTVDISDVSCALGWMLLGRDNPGCLVAINANGDTQADIADPIWILEFLFMGGPAPVEPFPSCGTDEIPANEGLSCDTPPVSCQ